MSWYASGSLTPGCPGESSSFGLKFKFSPAAGKGRGQRSTFHVRATHRGRGLRVGLNLELVQPLVSSSDPGLPVAPLWCYLGFFPNRRGNKAAANRAPPSALCVSASPAPPGPGSGSGPAQRRAKGKIPDPCARDPTLTWTLLVVRVPRTRTLTARLVTGTPSESHPGRRLCLPRAGWSPTRKLSESCRVLAAVCCTVPVTDHPSPLAVMPVRLSVPQPGPMNYPRVPIENIKF